MLSFLSFRLLKTDEEIGLFISRSCSLVGNQIPLPYLKAGRVVGAFLGNEMVGGWAFSYSSNGTLRCMTSIPYPTEIKEFLDTLAGKALLAEITQVWLDPEKVNSRQSLVFWHFMGEDAAQNCPPNLILGYKKQNLGLARLYSPLNPRVLYSGPIGSAGAAVRSHAEATFLLVSRSKFKFVLRNYISEVISRTIGKKRCRALRAKDGVSLETGKLESNAG